MVQQEGRMGHRREESGRRDERERWRESLGHMNEDVNEYGSCWALEGLVATFTLLLMRVWIPPPPSTPLYPGKWYERVMPLRL